MVVDEHPTQGQHADTGGIYLVWSHEHGAWWGPGRSGYTKGLQTAGRYSRDDALDICRNAIPTAGHIGAIAEIPVRLDDANAFLEGQTIPRAILEHVYRDQSQGA